MLLKSKIYGTLIACKKPSLLLGRPSTALSQSDRVSLVSARWNHSNPSPMAEIEDAMKEEEDMKKQDNKPSQDNENSLEDALETPAVIRPLSAPPSLRHTGEEEFRDRPFPSSLSFEDLSYNERRIGHTYSLPSRAEYASKAQWRWQNMLRFQSWDNLKPSSWFASQATRPLLLTFDAFDTIFTPKEPIAKQYCDVARTFGLELDEDAVMASFKKAFKAISSSHPNYGAASRMTPEKWWTNLITNTLTPLLPPDKPTLPADLPATLYTHFSTASAYTLFPDVLPFLNHIGQSSYSASHWAPRRTMLGLISNSDPRVRSILSSFTPTPLHITPSLFPARYTTHSRHSTHHTFGAAHFAFAALSYECEVQKPDPRIFDRAVRLAQDVLDRLHPVARLTRTGGELLGDVRSQFHCLHVGDEVGKDVIGALKAGWDVVLVDRSMAEAIGEREVEFHVEPEAGAEAADGMQYDEDRRIEMKKVKVTVVNSLSQLRYVITKERLEGHESPWSQKEKQNMVWLDPAKGEIEKKVGTKRVPYKQLKGRKIVDRGGQEQGLSMLV